MSILHKLVIFDSIVKPESKLQWLEVLIPLYGELERLGYDVERTAGAINQMHNKKVPTLEDYKLQLIEAAPLLYCKDFHQKLVDGEGTIDNLLQSLKKIENNQ